MLDGEKGLVVNGDSADALIVSARVAGGRRDRDGIGLFLVDADAPGVTRRGYPTQDGRRAAEIAFAKVRVEPENVLGAAGGRHCRSSSARSTRRSPRSRPRRSAR